MSTAAVDSYPSEVNYDASNMISKSLKRSRSCFEEEHEEENVQENFEEQCSSSCKKMRFSPAQQVRSTKSRQQQQQTHTATLRVTKEAVCNIKLTLLNQIASAGVENIEKLRIADFCSKSIINSYRYGGVENMPFQVPEFSIESANDASHVVLSYLRGMIVRKDEVAVIPIGDTSSKHMLLLFETQTLKTGSILDPLEELILHESNLHAILVPKFSVVFDLDETLIKTRLPKDDNDLPMPGEVEFKVFNTRLITMIRSGTDLVLKWASQLFNVHIFTNAVFEYAKEICKVLDPTRTTLLANLNEENESEWRALIKSRGDFDQVEYLPKALGLKDLAKFSICTFSTVVLDDDCNVWKQQDNVLPFSQVVGNNKTGSEFLHKMRTETWTRMVQLKKLQQQQAQQEVVLASQNVEYTIIASQESSN